MLRYFLLFFAFLTLSSSVRGDWHLQWSQKLPPRKPAWQFTARMPMDSSYHPVAAGKLAVVGCEHSGALLAFDLKTGIEQWRYYTNGPIRFAPRADENRIFLGSDDGYLYCLDHQGKLLWKRRGGPSERKIIGHERFMAAWPISTRPVLQDGKLYFTSGYWPLDGVFVYCVEAETGKVIWRNDNAQFRPFDELRVVGPKLYVRGHRGQGVYEIESGQELREKQPRFPRKEFPDVPSVEGSVIGRFASGNNLFVCTKEGGIFCFGQEKVKPRENAWEKTKITKDPQAQQILKATGINEGYCLVSGLQDGSVIATLLKNSNLYVVATDSNPAKVNQIRRKLDQQGCFADHRLSIITADPENAGFPPYFASLVLAENEGKIPEAFKECLRPFGGTWVERNGNKLAFVQREGPLPGSGNWTHETADPANSLASKETRVKAPLGLLWYGGEAAAPRFYMDGNVDHQSGHGINPQPPGAQVLDGRMFLQGPGLLGAVDIYTGRILWETKLPEFYTFGGPGGGLGIHSKKHPHPWKYPPALKFQIKPTQHPRASGFNFASISDGVYVGAGPQCIRINPKDGKILSRFPVPLPEKGLCWGRLRLVDDLIISTAFRPQDLADAEAGHDGQGGDWSGDRMPMAYLVVVNRHTGKLLWSRKADWGFINRGLAVGNGKVFCLDLIVERSLKAMRSNQRKFPDRPPMIYALDLQSGKELWKFELDVLVKYLSYSVDRDLLLVPCRNLVVWDNGKWKDLSFDARRGRRNRNAPGKMRGFRGKDGKIMWEVTSEPYFDPHMIVGDLIIDRSGYTYDLLTGKRHERKSPLTGLPEEWNFRRRGCNYLIGCENMVTWRTAFYDLKNDSGAMNLVGFDAGCIPTLIPAGGLLNISNFGTHHKRNRMTALALVHHPENHIWTKYYEKWPGEPQPIKHAGFNFGAPGDRRAKDGTLWLQVAERNRSGVIIDGNDLQWFSAHPSRFDSWISSSGIQGVTSLQVPTLVTNNRRPLSDKTKRTYTLRLYFAEPEMKKVGERVFSIRIGDKVVEKNLDIRKEAGETRKELVKEYSGIVSSGPIAIQFEASRGTPILCGVEIIARRGSINKEQE